MLYGQTKRSDASSVREGGFVTDLHGSSQNPYYERLFHLIAKPSASPNKATSVYGKRNHVERRSALSEDCPGTDPDAVRKRIGKMRSGRRSQCSIYYAGSENSLFKKLVLQQGHYFITYQEVVSKNPIFVDINANHQRCRNWSLSIIICIQRFRMGESLA